MRQTAALFCHGHAVDGDGRARDSIFAHPKQKQRQADKKTKRGGACGRAPKIQKLSSR